MREIIEVNVPDGVSGDWAIESFEVSEEDAKRHNCSFSVIRSGAYINPGKYKKLTYRGNVIMSNTDMEIRTHRRAIDVSQGNVLVTGLGLGMYLIAILKKDVVSKVTVIEKSQDVINLVSPTFKNDLRVTIINADAFAWKPPKGEQYDFVWHDIWPDICTDNLPEMTKLKRRFARKAMHQLCWAENECRRAKVRGW